MRGRSDCGSMYSLGGALHGQNMTERVLVTAGDAMDAMAWEGDEWPGLSAMSFMQFSVRE
jgi:hypothetical protein